MGKVVELQNDAAFEAPSEKNLPTPERNAFHSDKKVFILSIPSPSSFFSLCTSMRSRARN